MTTRIPAAANRRAMARPMPFAAPVTTAVRPRQTSSSIVTLLGEIHHDVCGTILLRRLSRGQAERRGQAWILRTGAPHRRAPGDRVHDNAMTPSPVVERARDVVPFREA